MDQVKHFLRLAVKYHFWILCAIIAFLTLGTWWVTSGKLRAEFEKNNDAI
jgi:hypothetical protein